MNLAETPLAPGHEIQFGSTRVIFVSGFSGRPLHGERTGPVRPTMLGASL